MALLPIGRQFAAVFVLFALQAFASRASAERPPNVILIMADDVGWECFGCYGGQEYKTPNIDALAAKGLRFSHCYSQPLCTPSRVQIMTGKYNFRNYTHFGYLDPAEKTFGHMMKAAGYKTAIAGKWQLNGLSHDAPGYKDNTRPIQAGFDEYCLWQLTAARNSKRGGERYWNPVLEQNGRFLTQEDNQGQYGPDIMSDFVCDFIQRQRDEPFFVYYPTVLVHDPFVPTPDTLGVKSDRKDNFIAMVEYLDKIVGKIVRQVDEIGQLENTIILFTADNGTNTSITSQWNGRSIRGGKGGTTDMGTHVPLVASWKGHTPPGRVLDDLIDFSDFYPTLAEAAGVQIEPASLIDGRSFHAQLNGQPGNPREWVFCHYQPYWGKFAGSQFVRDQSFKLYRDGRLIHVEADIDEKHAISNPPTNATAAAARGRLKRMLDSAPPAPPVAGGRKATKRPIHPNWKSMRSNESPPR